MKKIVSALIVSAAISTPAFAAADPFSTGVVGSKYAVVDIGSISYGSLGSATALSVGGGFQVHPAVAVEVDYLMGSKYSYNSAFGTGFNYQLTALQIMAVGNYAISNELSAYGKAGLAFNSQKVNVPFFGATSTTSNDLTWAFGIKYKVTKEIALRAQYQETGISSVNVLSVGAMFNF